VSRRTYEGEYENYNRPRRRPGCWLMLIVLAALATCGGGVVAFLLYLGGDPNAIEILEDDFKAPETVALDETFAVEFTVKNVSLDPVTINGVGLDKSLLDGVEVVEISVEDQSVRLSTEDRNYPLYGDWREYELDRDVPDGDTVAITFMFKATKIGIHSGDLTVWIESDFLGMPIARARRKALDFDVR
jgi:hypothetical protein